MFREKSLLEAESWFRSLRMVASRFLSDGCSRPPTVAVETFLSSTVSSLLQVISEPASSTFSTSTSLSSLSMSILPAALDGPNDSASEPSDLRSRMSAGSSPSSASRFPPMAVEWPVGRGGRSEKSTVCWLLSGLLLPLFILLLASSWLLSLSRVMITGELLCCILRWRLRRRFRAGGCVEVESMMPS